MKILKHGNKINQTYQFTCKECHCVFELNHDEFTKNCYLDMDWSSMEIKGKEFIYQCPECGSVIRYYI